jgi:hypothetical protein
MIIKIETLNTIQSKQFEIIITQHTKEAEAKLIHVLVNPF